MLIPKAETSAQNKVRLMIYAARTRYEQALQRMGVNNGPWRDAVGRTSAIISLREWRDSWISEGWHEWDRQR